MARGSGFGIVILAVLAMLAACGPQAGGGETATGEAPRGEASPPLEGTSWVLLSLEGDQLLPGSRITLNFEESTAGGFAGCNSYGGNYRTEDSDFFLDEIEMTAMACLEPEGVMEQEARYLDLLRDASHYEIAGDMLTFSDESGGTVLAYEREAEVMMDPSALSGTSWRLDNVEGMPPLDAIAVTLHVFSEEWVGGQACRGYIARYTATTDGLAFPTLSMLDLSCPDDAALRQEARYTDALSWTSRFEVREGRLDLFSERGEILHFERVSNEDEASVWQGATWTLAAFISSAEAVPENPLPGALPTARFEGGSLSGEASCNSYNASYTLEGQTLSVGRIARTKKFCGQPEGVMAQEERFLSMLERAVAITWHGQWLWVNMGDGQALLFRAL